MAVYIDNARGKLGRMQMAHMIADTSDELHAMADIIGSRREWCQEVGTYREHYDVPVSRRLVAIEAGAIEISRRTLGLMLRDRRKALDPQVNRPGEST